METKAQIIRHRLPYIIFMSLAMMWLAPWGSFDPMQTGFYRAIFFACLTEIILYKFIEVSKDKEK
jgi:hypothetical protein